MKKRTLAAVLAITIVFICSCSAEKVKQEPTSFEHGKLTVSFEYKEQSGYASNQFAVWIEDIEGTYVNTLYVTEFTADGGYEDRPDSIPLWVEKSGLASMQEEEADAVTGATPDEGTLAYAWDLTDSKGNVVPPGEYKFFVEGSLRWKNRVLYSGIIHVGGNEAAVEAEPEYFYEASEDEEALTENSEENSMLSKVKAEFTV